MQAGQTLNKYAAWVMLEANKRGTQDFESPGPPPPQKKELKNVVGIFMCYLIF
jgi:hypothetical protein